MLTTSSVLSALAECYALTLERRTGQKVKVTIAWANSTTPPACAGNASIKDIVRNGTCAAHAVSTARTGQG